MIVSSLDEKTCEVCRAADGRPGKAPVAGCYAEGGCRCVTQTTFLEAWERLGKEGRNLVDELLRSCGVPERYLKSRPTSADEIRTKDDERKGQ